MPELRKLSPDSVSPAIEKARHYRLLNQPEQAESICLDVLEIDPDNQPALIILLLARTDQLDDDNPSMLGKCREVIGRLEMEYHKSYYQALLCERQAMQLLKRRGRRSSLVAYQWFGDAIKHYETAIELKPADDDEAILRWNFCNRIIERHCLRELDPEELQDLGIE